MKKITLIFIFIFHLRNFDVFVKCFSFQSKTIKLSSFSECPDDEDTLIHFNGTITKAARNQYAINGEFTFGANITSPIEVFRWFL